MWYISQRHFKHQPMEAMQLDAGDPQQTRQQVTAFHYNVLVPAVSTRSQVLPKHEREQTDTAEKALERGLSMDD